jgi:DNA repair photolyase
MAHSTIEWTESTWNPLTGCTKISPGCKHCYAERMAKRLQAMGQQNYVNGFKLTTHEHVVEKPLEWKTPQVVFVNSMSDQACRAPGGIERSNRLAGKRLDGGQCRESRFCPPHRLPASNWI